MEAIMRILVCGGRDFNDAAKLNAELDAIHAEHGITELIHGCARGADTLAQLWANSQGIMQWAFPADWNKHGKSAGFIPNSQMLSTGQPDLVVAFPGGKGTAHMVNLTVAAGIRMKRITS
jgi:hypothetical protein